MANTTLPKWLTPGAIVYHTPTTMMFIAVRCVRRRDGAIALIDALPGTKGNEYLLDAALQPLQIAEQGC